MHLYFYCNSNNVQEFCFGVIFAIFQINRLINYIEVKRHNPIKEKSPISCFLWSKGNTEMPIYKRYIGKHKLSEIILLISLIKIRKKMKWQRLTEESMIELYSTVVFLKQNCYSQRHTHKSTHRGLLSLLQHKLYLLKIKKKSVMRKRCR